MTVFSGDFSSIADIVSEFQVPQSTFDNLHFFYADYDCPPYEGHALVVGYDFISRKFFHVEAHHCSCYGCEEQWQPEFIEPSIAVEYFKRIFRGVKNNALVKKVLGDIQDFLNHLTEHQVIDHE